VRELSSNLVKLSLFGVVAGLILVGCAGDSPVTLGPGVAQLPNTGVRALATPTYTPEIPLVVSLSVVPKNGSLAYAIEDAPPVGWTVTNINENGVFDPLTNKVKWGIFFNQCPTYFTYTLTPPANANGTQNLNGTLSVDGVNVPVTGQGTLPHS